MTIDPKARKRILVTGATAGIGKETARSIAAMGHLVYVHGRSQETCDEAIDDIKQSIPEADLTREVCDLSSLSAIRSWARELRASEPLDVIVNNAGVVMREPTLTEDGFEATWAINHLAPFLLTHLLLDQLLERPESRVINVSSIGHTAGVIHFDDPNLTGTFDWMRAYCQSKLANILFTQELSRRTSNTSLVTHALHPGTINTKLLHRTGFGNQPTESASRGARTSVFLATDPTVTATSGRYFVGCKESGSSGTSPALGKRLWDLSMRQCGLSS